MKKLMHLLLTVSCGVTGLIGCADRTELTPPSAPSPVSGTADFTRYVAIGNTITTGFQSGALYESAQAYAYPNLIARQTGADFAIPSISDPGLGAPGRMKVADLDTFTVAYDQSTGVPLNLMYAAPYNNLAIPGALLYDVLNATDSVSCASYVFGNPLTRTGNPFFNLVLRGQGSQFAQARALQPTFITLWIGDYDVLGFAMSGGAAPAAPTPAVMFQGMFAQLADSLASLGAEVVVANVPPVTALPYFTTIGPKTALATTWARLKLIGAPGLIYQKHGETLGTGVADSLTLLTCKACVTMPGSTYMPYVSQPTGKFYTDNHYPALPAGIDTTKPFGLHPQNPIPDALVLDSAEIATALSTTIAYNAAISAIAAAKDWGVVDVFTLLENMRAHDFSGGTSIDGIPFTTGYVTGGMFSLDGLNPTSQGQAIIANAFLTVINRKYGSHFEPINVGTIPGSLILAE
jgi:hypothetical protein